MRPQGIHIGGRISVFVTCLFTKMTEKYVRRRAIHSGKHGEVFEAERLRDHLPVAMKVLKMENCDMCDGCCRGNVPLEVCFLQRCRGVDGVIKLLDCYTVHNKWIIIMERPEPCQDLLDWLDYRSLNEPTARHIFRQLYKTVQTLAKMRIVHGDIKLDNVLVNLETYETKLVDFGYASEVSDTVITRHQGTSFFAPPEYIKSHRYTWEGNTVWTLGCVLHGMMHENEVFRNDKDKVKRPVKIAHNLSKELTDLIRVCLTKDPSKRITLEEIGKHAWMNE